MYKVIRKQQLSDTTFSFWISAQDIAKKAKAGQFLHILCGGDTFLRRPISICQIEGDNVRFIFSVVGKGTQILADKQVGDMLDVLGPLGRGFDTDKRGTVFGSKSLVVGGGIGVFPLLELSNVLREKGDDVDVVLGFRNEKFVLMLDEFKNLRITTDDGSMGKKGFVTDAMQEIIAKSQVDKIYACGPMPMLKSIVKLAKQHDIWCEVSLEERMACGVGACMGCVCKTNKGYETVCKEGPVFNANEVNLV